MSLPGVAFKADMDLIRREIEASESIMSQNRPLKRLMGLLQKGSPNQNTDKSWSAKFLRSPIEILGNADRSRVRGIQYALNRLEGPLDQRKAVATGEFESDACGVVLKSIGYKSAPIPDVPFDARKGIVPNQYGKVVDGEKEVPGMYAAGWLKRGPTGVIVSTMSDAYETADTIVDDLKNGKEMLQGGSKEGADGLIPTLKDRGIVPVSYSDWKKIEAAEFALGGRLGKPREKFSRVEDMLSVLERS